MPNLNYTTPLKTFSGTSDTYTATKECYLYGCTIASGGSGTIVVSINNKPIATGQQSTSAPTGPAFVMLKEKLKSGDKVTVATTGAATIGEQLYVLALA